MGVVDAIEWAWVLCDHRIQNDWVSRATNLHQILCQAWTFLHGNYLDDSEGRPQLWATGDWQLHHDNSPTHASHIMQFFVCWNIKSPWWPRIGILQLLVFPKTKITFEKEEISDCPWDSEKYYGAADGDWESSVRCRGAYFEGDWGVIVLCTIFLVSCIFFNKCLYFSHYMAGYLLDRPCVLVVLNSGWFCAPPHPVMFGDDW